jgi:hypothetical protein
VLIMQMHLSTGYSYVKSYLSPVVLQFSLKYELSVSELAGPCSRRQCQTGSVCDAVDGSSKCLCPIGYTGTACEKR